MPRPATWKDMKKVLLRGLFAATLTALIGIFSVGISAAGDSQLWSVVVHIEYSDGTVYEHAFAVGVPTSTLSSILEECGRSHRGGSAVRYHCYPIPE
jgi:hypothetical protein